MRILFLLFILSPFLLNAQDTFYIKCVDADNLIQIDSFIINSESDKIIIDSLNYGISKISNLRKGESFKLSASNYTGNTFHRYSKKEELVAKYNEEKIYHDGDTIIIELLLDQNLLLKRWTEEDQNFSSEDTSNIEKIVDVEPSFKDETEFNQILSSKLHFPKHVIEKNIQGRIYFSLIIEQDGSFSNIKIIRSVDEYLDRIALRALRSKDLPTLNAAIKNGVTVRRKITYPINFNLH